jgi:hypothetical protein
MASAQIAYNRQFLPRVDFNRRERTSLHACQTELTFLLIDEYPSCLASPKGPVFASLHALARRALPANNNFMPARIGTEEKADSRLLQTENVILLYRTG